MTHKGKRPPEHARSFSTKLDERCRLSLPAELREVLNVGAGDRLVFIVEAGEVKLASLRAQLEKLKGRGARLKRPGERAVETFLRGRRREAERE